MNGHPYRRQVHEHVKQNLSAIWPFTTHDALWCRTWYDAGRTEMRHGIRAKAKGLSIRTSNQQKHIIYKLWNLNPYSSHVQTPTHYNAQQNTLRPFALKIPLRLYIYGVCGMMRCDDDGATTLRCCCSLPFSLHAFNFTLPACIAWLYVKSLLYL